MGRRVLKCFRETCCTRFIPVICSLDLMKVNIKANDVRITVNKASEWTAEHIWT
jgi:hypothetical protein